MLVSNPRAATRPATARSPYAPLDRTVRTAACFAGTGLAGLIAAHALLRAGHEVAVLAPDFPAEPAAAREAVPIASGIEASFVRVEREDGPRAARDMAHAGAACIEWVQALVRRERFACDFERLDAYRFAGDDETLEALEEEAAAARRAGIAGAEALAFAPVDSGAPRACLHWPSQAQVNEEKLAAALTRALAHAGAALHGGVEVDAFRQGAPSVLEASSGARIEAETIALGQPPARPRREVGALVMRLPRGSVTRAIYRETVQGVLHCARLAGAEGRVELLLVSGEAPAASLERWARDRFPRAGDIVRTFTTSPPPAPDVFAFRSAPGDSSSTLAVTVSPDGAPLTQIVAAALRLQEFHDPK